MQDTAFIKRTYPHEEGENAPEEEVPTDESSIETHAFACCCSDKVFAACYFAGGAEEFDFHT